jgi:hypothetical protein
VRRLCVEVVASLLVLLASACGGGHPRAATESDYDPANFSNSSKIDNRWFPLMPGTKLTFEGRANRGAGILPHRVVFVVTDLTKVIDRVRTAVMWERDFNHGQLAEAELAFHAQDDDGNVWNLGEYPEVYEQGKLVGADDTWITGLTRARAGILMRAEPRVGSSSYLQGWAPEIEFRDRAREYKSGQRSCVPVDCFNDVLVTDEWNPLDPPDGHQLKYYARGVGTIRVEPGAGSKEQETLVLVEKVRLDAKALAAARDEALKLDTRAYDVSKDLYRHTPPAVPAPRADKTQ